MGLGSNKDNRVEFIQRAVNELNSMQGCMVTNCSFLYETKPYGNVKQDNYYNAVCECFTNLTPAVLFKTIKNIENKLGRKKSEKWGPREIDIDILLYNDLIYKDECLNIPHPEMIKRDFVIIPLLEINPDIIHPELKIKLNSVIFEEKDRYIIKKSEINPLNSR